MTSIRRRLSATATLLLVPTLAACGFGAQTNHQYQSAAGSDSLQVKDASGNLANSASPIQVYNAAIAVQQGNPNGVFVGTFVNNSAPDPAQGYNASNGALVDNGTAATVDTMSIAGASTPVGLTLPVNTSYKPQPIGCGNGDYGLKVTLDASQVEPAALANGEYVTMQFSISVASGSTQTVTMQVPVFPVTSADFPEGGAGGIYDAYYSDKGAVSADQCPTQTAKPAASAIWTGAAVSSDATATSTATATAQP